MLQEWIRPATTRRYLQPPMAERMYTLWAEGKVILGEVEVNPGPTGKPYETLDCCGLWFYYDHYRQADFHTAHCLISDDGAPIHGLANSFGRLQVFLEAFCNITRTPSCFLKLTLSNPSDIPITETFGMLLRSGKESDLVFGAPDVYLSYQPDISRWIDYPATWKKHPERETLMPSSCLLREREYHLLCETNVPMVFDPHAGSLSATLTLSPGESCTMLLALGKGTAKAFSYEAERSLCSSWWQEELKKIKKLPTSLLGDSEKLKMIRHLTAQLLQCFCKPVGEEFVLCRQGGLQRFIWPYEAMSVLDALGQLGDFGSYIEPVISLYFDVLQAPDGEIVPLGLHWANCTAMCLYSFAAYAASNHGFYQKYRQKALDSFRWIGRTRASTIADDHIIAGLFPPKRSCDDELVLQAWGGTDGMNLIGLQKLYETAARYEDPIAAELLAEYRDYRSTLQSCYDKALALADGKDELEITTFPPGVGGDESKFAFQPPFSYLAYALDASGEDIERMLTFLTRHGYISHGLYCRMPDGKRPSLYNRVDDDGVVRVWYTTAREYYWFLCFLRLGDRIRAKELLEATMRYSMSPEYAMLERYHERDPYYSPWSPNASANGRLLLMLLKFYSVEE